ncbi:hypothetical protein [Peptostreptococcus faecalis]|uniref:hypothetical protein n=1 Tax=Peptostreptococcus faecalis TaxID=2045015 RepID=UPI000C7AF720|nr:hypothetical protein [Peptostreptococcus faecalis]
MKKTNSIELKVNVGKNVFEINPKHEMSPILLLDIVSSLLTEYNMILMENDDMESVDVVLGNLEKVVDRVESLGDIKLKIVQYQPNTFNVGKQNIYEIEYEKKYTLIDVSCVLTLALSYMKDTLIDSFAMDAEVHKTDREEAIKEMANFRRAIETASSLSNINGIIGYNYKKENPIDSDYVNQTARGLDRLLQVSEEMLSEVFSEDEKEIEETDLYTIETERYDRIVDIMNSHEHHHHHHHQEGGCGCGGEGHKNKENEGGCGCGGEGHKNKESEGGCGCGGEGHKNKESEGGCGCGGEGHKNKEKKELKEFSSGCGCGNN